jgi:hypothetical protein
MTFMIFSRSTETIHNQRSTLATPVLFCRRTGGSEKRGTGEYAKLFAKQEV